MASDGHSGGDSDRISISKAEEIVESVEDEVIAEDKLGASRNDVAEGTCQRIIRRLRSLDPESNRSGGGAGD